MEDKIMAKLWQQKKFKCKNFLQRILKERKREFEGNKSKSRL